MGTPRKNKQCFEGHPKSCNRKHTRWICRVHQTADPQPLTSQPASTPGSSELVGTPYQASTVTLYCPPLLAYLRSSWHLLAEGVSMGKETTNCPSGEQIRVTCVVFFFLCICQMHRVQENSHRASRGSQVGVHRTCWGTLVGTCFLSPDINLPPKGLPFFTDNTS